MVREIIRDKEPQVPPSSTTVTYVHNQFLAFCRHLSPQADSVLVNAEWQKILTAYTSADRHYHTLETLAILVQKIFEYVEGKSDRFELMASAFYSHLYLGNTARGIEEGAEFLSKTLGVTKDYIERVKSRIIAERDQKKFLENDPLGALYVDLTRLMLGAGTDAYKECVKNIRHELRELKHYTKAQYHERRYHNFVLLTLARPRIFASEVFPEWFEGTAHKLGAEKTFLEDRLKIKPAGPSCHP